MLTIAIQDANIIIDLVKTGLFDRCLALPYSFATTDIILDELIEEQAAVIEPHIKSGKFYVITITAEELVAIQKISLEETRLSEQDWSAFYYAQKQNAKLLTGDKRLRNIAESKGVPVCGIFWVLDQLVETQILTKSEACFYLKKLIEMNKRLPQDECDKRIELWCE